MLINKQIKQAEMAYHSIFDRIAREDPALKRGFKQQGYAGTLEAILDETEDVISPHKRKSKNVNLILHPPRIIRAYLDYKIQNPSAPEIEELLRDSIQLGLDIYKGEERAAKELEELRYKTIETGNSVILEKDVIQNSDGITWRATNPALSIDTAHDLAVLAKGESVLFLAMAHGGVAAGMDTYLRYCDYTGADNSIFYAARFSTTKFWDKYPQVSSSEIAYLREQSQDRRIVLFDEDRQSGKTLDTARHFFSYYLLPQEEIIVVSNLDQRSESEKSREEKKADKIGGYDNARVNKKQGYILYSNKLNKKEKDKNYFIFSTEE